MFQVRWIVRPGFSQSRSIPRLVFLFLLFGLIPTLVYAQDSPVTVSVNSSEVSTDDLVYLTVTAVNDSPRQPRPILPPLDGLSVIDLDIATNVTLVRGQIQTQVVYTYELQPRRTGTLTIPAIPVKFNDDEVVETVPLSLKVTQGAAPAPSPHHAVPPGNVKPPPELNDQDFFVEAVVDQGNPFVGQQLTYIFRFYQAIKIYRPPQIEMPLFNGFETLGMPVQEYNLDLGDRTYLVMEMRTALFPKSSGNLNIGAAQLIFPGTFFEDSVELYTKPLQVRVKPLPEGAPPEFSGAVGRYELQAWFSPQVAVINQPSTLSVAVSGTGNINALPDPIWPSLPQWRVYDSLSSQSAEVKDGLIGGTRVYERLMVSDRLGDLRIPPVELVYFDPVAEEYRSTTSQSITVRVIAPPTPDPAQATAAAQAIATPEVNLDPVDDLPGSGLVNPDLFDSARSSLVVPLGVVLVGTICGGLPLAVIAGAGGVWLLQKRRSQPKKVKPAAAGLRQSKQSLHPVLLHALADSSDNYQAINRALTRYLSERLGVPVAGLTRNELAQRLKTREVSLVEIGKIQAYLDQAETGRFGPPSEDAGWELVGKTDKLLHALDGSFDDPRDETQGR
ncbi:MAG TPA: BatD family protein, partial [Anaerolineae bacterium]|nr:BatD family protein [Anaerolineae bacterium]